MAQTTPFEPVRGLLGEQSYTNYVAHLAEIERVQAGIAQNRNGQLPLTEITNDRNRLTKRIARENMEVDRALERINGVPNFQDVSVIRKILRSASSVCRILIQNNFGVSGYGTGFLVSPNVLITNNHVLPDPETARQSVAQFSYEIDDTGHALTPVTFRLRPDQFFLTSTYQTVPGSPFDGRDFTLVAVEPTGSEGASLDRFGFIQMDGTLGKIIEGENCVVIQHPKGDYKKIVLKDIRLITLTDNFLIYESDTLPGSSGSVVLGLGTASVVGLHHSSIPRKDAAGNWLRKDGSPVQPNDPDELIDWIGNEGVRVSCIVDAFNNLPVPDSMQPLRRQLIDSQTLSLTAVKPVAPPKPHPFGPPSLPPRKPAAGLVSVKSESTEVPASLQYFEVILADQAPLQDAWEQQAPSLVEGLVDDTPLVPGSLDPLTRRMRYLTVRASQNPWELAARIEALPHVESCKPDLQTLTDVGVAEGPEPGSPFESFTGGGGGSGLGTWREEEKKFLSDFRNSPNLTAALAVRPDYYRWWNWVAINCPEDGQRNADPTWQAISQKLASLRFVQFDTGYSAHSKVFTGFDTDKDFDFIEGDFDARDLLDRKLLKHPGHGTRTGSLAIGHRLTTDPNTVDGNGGLLTFAGKAGARLIPYRISRSVILLGRGKELVDAANYAVRSQADVLFMSMGTYPKAMFAAIAREVYEHGIIWVCAAGNEVELVVAPAVYPGTIAVAATNPNDDPWRGSSNGPAVDIAAPGESVYVPTVDDEGTEFMSYGNGTSYATPQVASAALLWKARHLDQLIADHYLPWQVVEAFRATLKATARKPANWTPRMFEIYGAGVLDVQALLDAPLPKASTLHHAYENQPTDQPNDLGIVEAGHFIWNIFKRKLRGGPAESTLPVMALTPRGQQALDAFAASSRARAVESAGLGTAAAQEALLRAFFRQ